MIKTQEFVFDAIQKRVQFFAERVFVHHEGVSSCRGRLKAENLHIAL